MGTVHMEDVERDQNFLAAIARGTIDGLGLAVNVGSDAGFLPGIDRADQRPHGRQSIIGWAGTASCGSPPRFSKIFGWVFAPVAYVIGIPWHDCVTIGNLLGTRMVLNELVAFSFLGPMKGTLDPRSFTIATFALCGFANFSSIGMQIGGIGALAPNKKAQLAKFGIRAMLAGTMANLIPHPSSGYF